MSLENKSQMDVFQNRNKPIAVFDSGVGGLTVLNDLLLKFPNESFIYLGDTARLPYGSKSSETITKYTLQNLKFLNNLEVKCIVIACNSASTSFLEDRFESVPVFNVIEPTAKFAVQQSKTKNIAVLGTKATVKSQIYTKKIFEHNPTIKVFSVACPLFVPFAEEALFEDPMTNLLAYRYLSHLKPLDIDTAILGCTHYPLLKNSIQKALGSQVSLIESGHCAADSVNEFFDKTFLHSQSQENKSIKILSTDENSFLYELAKNLKVTDHRLIFELVNTV